MILIAIDRYPAKFTLHAADTHIGAFYMAQADSIEEIINRFLPNLKAWSELGSSGAFGPERPGSTKPGPN